MLTRRSVLKLSAAATALTIVPLSQARAAGSVAWQYFQADEAGFRRTPVLLTGESDAILIDGGFTLSDGSKVAEAIKATGKQLKTIFISCNDPDYYFSLRPIVEAFPDAAVIAKPVTVEAINANVQSKLDTWSPQLLDNGPKTLQDVVLPVATDATTLDLEGFAIDIVEVPTLHDRRYLWVPSLEAVFGGVLVYSGIHVWVADEGTTEKRAAWVKALDELIARNPKILIPGHQADGAAQRVEAATFTRDYLLAFEEEVAKGADSAAVIAGMTARYPDLLDISSLELGAQVAKGEIQWG